MKRLQLRLGKNNELILYADGVPVDGVLRVATSYDRDGSTVRIELDSKYVEFYDQSGTEVRKQA